MISRNKHGAIELSVSTIVVLVIGMTMLIMGILLVRNIFGGAIESVNKIDEGVKGEINKLFSDNTKKVVVRLPNNEVSVKKGEDFGIAFGIRNVDEGESQAGIFAYNIKSFSIERNCQNDLTSTDADNYLILGYSGKDISLRPGDEPEAFVVHVQPPSTAPLCDVQYKIDVTKGNQPYDSELFTVKIIGN